MDNQDFEHRLLDRGQDKDKDKDKDGWTMNLVISKQTSNRSASDPSSYHKTPEENTKPLCIAWICNGSLLSA